MPTYEDVRISHKEQVLETKALIEAVKEMDPEAVLDGEEIINVLLEKINYLENEPWLGFTHVTPNGFQYNNIFRDSNVQFEGYFYGVKYLERVEIGGVEANIEYIGDLKIGNHNYQNVWKYNLELEFESGLHVVKVEGFSQSGQKNNTVSRFYVDTIAPVLMEFKVLNIEEGSIFNWVTFEITVYDNFGGLKVYIANNIVLNSDFRTDPVTRTIIAEDLALWADEDEVEIVLMDTAGNITKHVFKIR